MLKRSIIGQKLSMTLSLDSWNGPEDTERVSAEVREAASEIASLNAEMFSSHIHKLLLCRNPERAKKLVNVLTDTELTPTGVLVARLLTFAILMVPVVLIVLLVTWLAK